MQKLRPMSIADYDAVMTLMKNTPGVGVRDADSLASTQRYLERNPDLSFVAEHSGKIIGCIMSGHDGRRGYLQHLVVHPNHRGNGIARSLVERCLAQLESLGIQKSHIDVFKTNERAASFWQYQGWKLRTDIDRYSFIRSGGDNA